MAGGAERERAQLRVAAGLVVLRAELPDRVGELADRERQPGGRRLGAARVAQHVAGEHARVAHGEVDLRHRVLVAAQDRLVATAGEREAGRLLRRGQRVLERLDVIVDLARGPQRLLGAAGVAGLERPGGLLERVPELADHGLRGTVDHQDGIRREQQRRDRESDPAADQAFEDAVGGEAGVGLLERREQDR